MATAHKIRDLIAQTTTGTARHHVPREVRDEVCRYAGRRRSEGAAWAVIARETGLGVPKLQRWIARARPAASVPGLRPVEAGHHPHVRRPHLAVPDRAGRRESTRQPQVRARRGDGSGRGRCIPESDHRLDHPY